MGIRSAAALVAFLVFACTMVAGCSQGKATTGTASTASAAATPASPVTGRGGSKPSPSARLGSADHPLAFTCADAALPGDPHAPYEPRPGDLVIGPFFIADSNIAAHLAPSQFGYRTYGRAGRSYKMPVFLKAGSSVTMAITGAARGHVVIDNPYAQSRGISRLTAATYHACSDRTTFFAQGFAFTAPPFRECVPLDITIGGRSHHVILSLFAGECKAL